MKKEPVGLIILFFFSIITGRSPFRRKDPYIPRVDSRWLGETKTYTRYDSHYEKEPLFTTFHEEHVNQHLLPMEKIPYRNDPAQSVNGTILSKLIEQLIIEVKQKKRQYTQFIVLQHRNFNRRKQCGLLVLQFKNHPFVLKLFMETPQTFINSYCKGLENKVFFFMGGGTNRHVSGLTRIRNLELVNQYIAESPQWKDRIITPRKWFWLPKNSRYIELIGTNINKKTTIATKYPGIYAIVADLIDTNHEIAMPKHERNAMIMDFCNDLQLFVDPHTKNFIVGYNEEKEEYTLSLIDTEHFPSMVGIKEVIQLRSHTHWYLYLAEKATRDIFLRNKQKRRTAQTIPNQLALSWENTLTPSKNLLQI